MTTLDIDAIVPAFSADAVPQPFKLEDYRGKKLVLYFYPKDNTPGCTAESIAFRNYYEQFQQANTAVVGISRDSLASHEKFIQKLDLPFNLISDAEEVICNQFDVMRNKKRYGKIARTIERSTFLLDESGKIIRVWRNVKVEGHVLEVLKTISELA